MKSFQFHECLMLRTPSFNYWDYDLAQIPEIIKAPLFQTAIYLANPVLYHLLESKQFDFELLKDKERLTLLKYYNRISFRPTPFGLFAGFGMVKWGQESPIRLAEPAAGKAHLLLDQEVIWKLAAGGIEAAQSVWINPTLYQVNKEFRFIKTTTEANTSPLVFSLESIEANKILISLKNICGSSSKNISDLVPIITEMVDCSAVDAMEYIQFLVSAQYLITDQRANVVGKDYREIKANNQINELLKQQGMPNMERLLDLKAQINAVLQKSDQKPVENPFYLGFENKLIGGHLASHWQAPLKSALMAVGKLNLKSEFSPLQNFITEFVRRFDQQKLPLLEVMDPYIGMGYASLEQSIDSALLEQLPFNKANKQTNLIPWSPIHSLLLSKWVRAPGVEEIVLDDTDLTDQELVAGDQASLSVVFRLVNEGQILLEGVGGASATSLIGRFTPWSAEVFQTAKQLAQIEQRNNPELIFAEIGQLSDTHTDNINRRQHLFDYEVPINTISTLPTDKQIELADLLVSVADNRIVLESVSRKKNIIPRLSSAFNYSRNDLAIFRFLCDLQYQHINPLALPNLEQFFPGLTFYPRLRYGPVIVSPAKWYLNAVDLPGRRGEDGKRFIDDFNKFKEHLNLPDIIALVRHDQQIVFNLSNEQEIDFFLKASKGAERIHIQEFFLPDAKCSTVTRENSKPVINQFVGFLYQDKVTYPTVREVINERNGVKPAEFLPGSQWLYLKLYCHPAISNWLLVKRLQLAIDKLKTKFSIKWFFIRYMQGGYHIRLRIKIKEENVGAILKELKFRFAKDVQVHIVRQYEMHTYYPEWERYGVDMMPDVEAVFCASSELVIGYLKKASGANFKLPYYSLALVSMSTMIAEFIPTNDQQIEFLQKMVHSFYQEFSEDKKLKVELDAKYRQIRPEITLLLDDKMFYEKLKLTSQRDQFFNTLSVILSKVVSVDVSRQRRLLGDLVHMHLNRAFVDDQRKQELVLYYCLWKQAISAQAQNRRP